MSADELVAGDPTNRLVAYRDIAELVVQRDVGQARLILREHDGRTTRFRWWAVNDPGADPAEIVRLSVGYAARVARPPVAGRRIVTAVAAVVAVAAGWTLRAAIEPSNPAAAHAERACQMFRDAGRPMTTAAYRSVFDDAGREMDRAASTDDRFADAASAIRWLADAVVATPVPADLEQRAAIVTAACHQSRLSA